MTPSSIQAFSPALKGIYETLRSHRGQFIFLSEHQHRLDLACRAMGVPSPSIKELVKNYRSLSDVRIRIDVFLDGNHTVNMQPLPRWNGFLYHKQWRCTYVNRQRMMPHWKHRDTAALFELRDRSLQAGYDEIILYDEHGFISEGSISNVFFTDGTVIYTPQDNILRGTCRQFVLDLCSQHNITCIVKPLNLREVKDMHVFVTNAIRGLVCTAPVVQLIASLCQYADKAIHTRIKNSKQ